VTEGKYFDILTCSYLTLTDEHLHLTDIRGTFDGDPGAAGFMTEVADPTVSQAVLIGVSSYRRLPGLPSVANNLTDLHAVLQDTRLWGLPAKNCHVLADPPGPAYVSKILRQAAAATEPGGLLLVYYAGHALIDPDDDKLILALSDCDPEVPHEGGLPYDWVRRAITSSDARGRVVILDCAFSGWPTAGMIAGTSGTDAVADLAEEGGTSVLVSAPANQLSSAPTSQTNTDFTGELTRLLRDGLGPPAVDPAPPALTVRAIWRALRRGLEGRGYERPELRASSFGGDIPLVHNAAAPRHDLAGTVLYAAHWFNDEDLSQQAVLVLRHNDTGAVGVRLTRPDGDLPAKFPPSWRPLLHDPVRLFDGGPVARDGYIVVTMLRRGAAKPVRFLPIRDRLGTVALSALPEDLDHAVHTMRVFVGYLGWQAGELEELLDARALVPSRRNVLQVFTEQPEYLWRSLQGTL
jgi:putative transcriptional regulator